MGTNRLTRRDFLRLSAGGAAAALVAACAQGAPSAPSTPSASEQPQATATATEAAASVPAGTYNEAPMLKELVAAGDLPPVDERLPTNPRALTPVEEAGEYGGTWRRAYKGISDRWGPTKLLEEYAIEWDAPDADTLNITPNYVSSWEQSDDATEYTFTLREGIKWSDGEPFTTADIQFWYDWIYMVPEIGGTQESYYTLEPDTPMELEVVDDYTWTVRFPAPNPLLPITIASLGGGPPAGPTMAAPAHYLSQFIPDHPNGNQEMIDSAMDEASVSTWQELFGQAGNLQGPIAFWFSNPDLPVINPWHMKVPAPADPMIMERNPYYWQVDTENNQLPYIDQISHEFFDSNEVFDLWISQGRIDCQGRHTNIASFTLYKENESGGDYRVLLWKNASTNALHPNITTEDAGLAELFDTPDFREALSIAINRDEINQLTADGLAEPRQASPVSGSPDFDPEFETRWIEFDPERANQLLDDLGLAPGSDGIRVRPDGQPLTFTILHRFQSGSPDADEMDLVAGYWSDLGIKVNQQVVERSLYEERCQNGDVQVGVWTNGRSAVVQADPGRYLATVIDSPWAILYGNWWLDRPFKKAEPPEDHIIREIWSLWDQVRTEPDETKRTALFQQMLGIHKEHPWMIGTVGEQPVPMIVKNNFRNVPNGYIWDNSLRHPGLMNCQQCFMRQS